VLDILNGLPTIVTGIFIFGLPVIGHQQSGWAGAVALAIIMLPIVARASHEVLALVPDTLKEGGLALGATRRRTVLRIVLPTATGGVITGPLLAVARVAGETAPLLFTCAIVGPGVQTTPSQALASIPVRIFELSGSSSKEQHAEAWAAALLLIVFVLLLSVAARCVRSLPGTDRTHAMSRDGHTDRATPMTVPQPQPQPQGPPSPSTQPITAPPPAARSAAMAEPVSTAPTREVELERLRAYYGQAEQVKGIDLKFEHSLVTAIIGPSGCGKSTIVRCINRMHEEIPGARAEGRVLLDGVDVYAPGIDVVAVRRAIGMVFQKPNPFPTMSIYDNVASGLRLTGAKRQGEETQRRVESALGSAGLWEEVKDRLSEPGISLSGGQQQRLCIARSLAVDPEVILMDEPCSALDPIATLRIEELIEELKSRVTIVIVTHNMQQAARVADRTAFMLDGRLVEVGSTQEIFTSPKDPRTEEYVTGKFG
jgi:phosphate transport system ATP-binding protein